MSDSTAPNASVLAPNLSLVLERITDGFFALDANWRIAYMNAEARKLLEAPSEILGRFWLDAFPKARGRLFEREYHRAMSAQMPVQFVEFSETAHRWFEVKAYPSQDGLSVYFRDVSERIDAQREIDRNVLRQQALIDFGRAALGGRPFPELVTEAMELLRDIVDVAVVEVYDFERRSGGFTVRAAEGWNVGTAFDPAVPALSHVGSAVSTGEAFACSDMRIEPRARVLATLAEHDVLSCISAVIGTPHEPLGALAVYARSPRTFTAGDVRFVESIAQALAEASAALESNRRMAQVLESIRDAFVAVDRDLRITYVNARMAMFWNVDASEMIGVPIERFTQAFNDNGHALESFRVALVNDRALSFETLFGDRWFETRLYPFSNGVAGYVQDITSRKQEQQRVLGLNAELERRVAERTLQLELANKELESFSYSVSHDLRAPLRAIDGFSQALIEDCEPRLDERGKNYLERVRKAAQRMADLIDALLKLARVARADISYSEVDLSHLVQGVLDELQEGDPDRTVVRAVSPGLRASGEPQLLRVVLENLIGNAWKFTRGVPGARIEVGWSGESKEFYVRDTGAGFDMTYQNKLFGAFQRLHSSEEYEGTGIGLATVARIVHRHGGSIRAVGEVGKGATFFFTLPHGAGGAA